MGGCRCTFRSCTVNTLNFPGMHFFHYPIKNKERLALWVLYANYPQLYKFASGQAKNKVVCALHFRDECFMNYKKDRLIPQAIPTLSRLKNGLVLDHSVPGKPEPEKLPSTIEKHLIPPKGYVPLGLPEENLIDASVEMIIEDEEESSKPLAKRPRITKLTVTPTPTVFNKGVNSASDSSNNGQFEDEEYPTITLANEPYEQEDDQYGIVLQSNAELSNDSLSDTGVVDEIMDLNDIELLPAPKEDCIEIESENVVSRTVYEQTIETFEHELMNLRQECEKKELEAEARVAQLELELAAAKEASQLALSKAEAAESSAKEWKEKMEASLATNRELSKAAVMSKEKPTCSNPGPMTKAQLFIAIKKYLSASMTALVRMEMFGGSERQWKPDERQASIELLQLGEKVYKYFGDEWRFRLPPMKLVLDWTNEVTVEDEEDL